VFVVETLLQDLRYGVRMLAKHRGMTAVAALTLALGVGANAAIFSVVNAVLLRPLPYPDPERIAYVWERLPQGGTGSVSVPNLRDWREQNTVFEHIAAIEFGNYNLQSDEQPERAAGAAVTPDFFDVLGVKPEIGRALLAGEDSAGHNRVVVLGDGLWRSRFGADSQIVNKEISVDGEKYTVVGVMPPGFQFPSRTTEMWVPLVFPEEFANSRGNHNYLAVARLKPGVTLEQAREQMSVVARRLEQQYPAEQTNRGVVIGQLQEATVSGVRPALLTLMCAVGFVLLIACINVANLLLARGTTRRREIAIRAALGAARSRIIRQLLTESVLLALLGGALGLLVARWAVQGLLSLTAGVLPRADEVGLDWRVLGFALALSVLTGVAFGLAPALQTSGAGVQEALKESGSSGNSPRGNRLRSSLAVLEIAAAIVLLVGAGLLVKSFLRLEQVETGFNPEHVLTLRLSLPAARYKTPEAAANFYTRLLSRVSTLPGVEAAGAIDYLPVQQSGRNGTVQIVGQPPDPNEQGPLVEKRRASPDYFRVMQIPLVAGRFFDAQGRERTPVAIVNQQFVRTILHGQNPLGQRIQDDAGDIEIVGVVGDVRQMELSQPPWPELFMPYQQSSSPTGLLSMSLVVRSPADPASLTQSVKREVLAVDPAQPVYGVLTMEQVLDRSISRQRLFMVLLGLFATLALALAVVGIYSVMSFLVTQHTREIGIRVALGAQPRDVLALVLGQGLVLTAAGVVVGVGLSLALTRLMAGLLFGVRATDPTTLVAVPVLLALVATLACYVPARRATRVDPVLALRHE
jgi:putative ABC transport system permease protein